MLNCFRHNQFFETLWTVVCQLPPLWPVAKVFLFRPPPESTTYGPGYHLGWIDASASQFIHHRQWEWWLGSQAGVRAKWPCSGQGSTSQGGGPWRVQDTGWRPAAWLEGWGPEPDQLRLIPACGFALQAVTLFWHREGPSAVQAQPPLMNARPLAAGCENSECFKARP